MKTLLTVHVTYACNETALHAENIRYQNIRTCDGIHLLKISVITEDLIELGICPVIAQRAIIKGLYFDLLDGWKSSRFRRCGFSSKGRVLRNYRIHYRLDMYGPSEKSRAKRTVQGLYTALQEGKGGIGSRWHQRPEKVGLLRLQLVIFEVKPVCILGIEVDFKVALLLGLRIILGHLQEFVRNDKNEKDIEDRFQVVAIKVQRRRAGVYMKFSRHKWTGSRALF